MAKTIANDIRPGNIVEHQSRLWRVLKTEHVKPGKGGAFCQMEMKELKQGTKLNERFRSSETMDLVRLDQQNYQFLYSEGANMVLMNPDNYEQLEVPLALLAEQAVFLQDGMKIMVESTDTQVISTSIPEHVMVEVAETEAVIKGQTAASSNKPAIMTNGVRIMVPPFIAEGEKIIVNTTLYSYIERAKG